MNSFRSAYGVKVSVDKNGTASWDKEVDEVVKDKMRDSVL